MRYKIKNWDKFQHYKTRRPPWIRLYRDLLDDLDFEELSGNNVKILIKLWLIASEDEEKLGYLPDPKTLAWRLRISDRELAKKFNELDNWLDKCYRDASRVLAECKQDATPEQNRTETEQNRDRTETDCVSEFDTFWSKYPRKTNKKGAWKAWKALNAKNKLPWLNELLFAIDSQKLNGDRFTPHASTWLNGERWTDVPPKQQANTKQKTQYQQSQENLNNWREKNGLGETNPKTNRVPTVIDIVGDVSSKIRGDGEDPRGL